MKRSVLCIFMIAFFVLFSSCGNSGRKHKKEKTVEKKFSSDITVLCL